MKVPMKSLSEPETQVTQIFPTNLLTEKVDHRKVFYQFINHFPPHLRWISLFKDGLLAAEVLMSAEFVQLTAPILTTKEVERNDPIPFPITPNMMKFRMEIIFAGIRNASKISHFTSGRYKIEITMGELNLSSGFSSKAFKKNLNFLDPFASGYLLLPEQFQFWPPIIIKHLDCSHKIPTVIGASMIRRPEKFFVDEKPKVIQRFLLNKSVSEDVEAQLPVATFEIEESEPLLKANNIASSNLKAMRLAINRLNLPKFLQMKDEGNRIHPSSLENEYTWWTKFYNSNREADYRNDCIHQLTVCFDLNFDAETFENRIFYRFTQMS